MDNNYFMGLDGFVWFTGVVEDRNDPSQLGRVKVRCLGYHTENKNDIPTEDLPWAHVMHPVTDPSMQGMGSSPSFLLEGSWVVGFFRDGPSAQDPIVMGSIATPTNGTKDIPSDASVDNKVYDVTQFINKHPGGNIIKIGLGKDITKLFNSIQHSDMAFTILQKL